MNKKLMIIISTSFLIIISLATTTMIEFYYAKKLDRMPIFSLKSEDKVKQYQKYTSFFYNVYKCYSGYTTVQPLNKDEPYCPRVIKYDKDGYYSNINGLKISKKEYQMILNTSNTMNEIEAWTTKSQIEDSLIVAEEFERGIHKTEERNGLKIAIFREFVIINDYGDYDWVYQNNNKDYYKCVENDNFKEYKGGSCIGDWQMLKPTEKWCSLAKNTTINKIKDLYNSKCK